MKIICKSFLNGHYKVATDICKSIQLSNKWWNYYSLKFNQLYIYHVSMMVIIKCYIFLFIWNNPVCISIKTGGVWHGNVFDLKSLLIFFISGLAIDFGRSLRIDLESVKMMFTTALFPEPSIVLSCNVCGYPTVCMNDIPSHLTRITCTAIFANTCVTFHVWMYLSWGQECSHSLRTKNDSVHA